MNLYETIIAAYPELADKLDIFANGTIGLRNDSDGIGDYIELWNYSKPIPAGLKLGKDQAQSPKIIPTHFPK